MKTATFALLATAFLLACNAPGRAPEGRAEAEVPAMPTAQQQQPLSKSIYDYSFRTLSGEEISLSQYKGKKILFVNTASECGHTPQYEQLQQVHEQYGDRVAVLGFPSNQFGGQEPGSNEEIAEFCKLNYGVTFPLSEKVDVKGPQAHPVWKWLTSKELNGVEDTEVKWNFQKYLVSENGHWMSVYYSKTLPDDDEITRNLE